jgi:hypothetical protein
MIKKGDKIVCKKDFWQGLVKGEEYEVFEDRGDLCVASSLDGSRFFIWAHHDYFYTEKELKRKLLNKKIKKIK